MQVCVAWLEAHRNQPDSPEVDGEDEHAGGTDEATAEERGEGHSEHCSEDEDDKEQGNEVEGLPKEEESREEVDKEEGNEAITNQGGRITRTRRWQVRREMKARKKRIKQSRRGKGQTQRTRLKARK
jgi:hypothetical protein